MGHLVLGAQGDQRAHARPRVLTPLQHRPQELPACVEQHAGQIEASRALLLAACACQPRRWPSS